jgi:dolichyl-phosphate-mannose-protein mannosyltransferase
MELRPHQQRSSARLAPRALWAIMACAVLLRLGVALAGSDAPASTDESHWRDMGRAIHRDGLLAAGAHTYRPPLYPLLLAATYAGVGAYPLAVPVWQSLLGAAMCGLVWRIGARLGGAGVGLLAAAWMATYPLLVFFSQLIMAETLLVFLTLLSVLAALRLFERGGLPEALALGLSCGLTALCKSTLLAWLPLLLGVWAWRQWRYQERFSAVRAGVRAREALWYMGSRGLLVAVGLGLAMLPGSARNHAMTGHWVPVSTNLGVNLLVGHEPEASGLYRDGADYLGMFQRLVDAEPNAALADRLATRRMLTIMVAHPWRTAKLAVHKTRYFWSPWVTGAGGWRGLVGVLSSAPLLLLGLVGVWHARSSAVGATVGTLVVALTLVHALVFAHTRFRLPLDAALMAPAAWTVQRLWRHLRKGK